MSRHFIERSRPVSKKFRKGDSFASLDSIYRFWVEKNLGFNAGIRLIQEFFGIKKEAAECIWYVRQRTRGTDSFIARLVKADKIPSFDWSAIIKGGEACEEELQKYNL